MSPMSEAPYIETTGVPRASGDEPLTPGLSTLVHTCSPRERG